MELIKVLPSETRFVYEGMKQCFCLDEIRDFDDFAKETEREEYTVYHICHNGVKVGFAGIWQLQGFAFLEHVAIYDEHRNKGFGTKTVQYLQTIYPRIVLEMEPPVQKDQIRRYGFYTRLGFVLNEGQYFQPPYRVNGNSVELKLMSYPNPLDDFEGTVKEIYKKVYGIAK